MTLVDLISKPFNISCARYANIAQESREGLGHRFFNYLMLFDFAKRMRAIPLLSLKWGRKGGHGSFGWFTHFANLPNMQDFETFKKLRPDFDYSNFIHGWNKIEGVYEPYKCNIVFQSCQTCCSGPDPNASYWCHQSEYSFVETISNIIAKQFEKTPWGAKIRNQSLSDDNCLNIVGHIRNGDKSLGCDYVEYERVPLYDTMRRLILMLNAECYNIYYISQERIDEPCRSYLFHPLNMTKKLHHKISFRPLKYLINIHYYEVIENDVYESLMKFLSADILVGSGSSFPIVAAHLSRWLIHIAPLPKELSPGIYYLSSDIQINIDGTLSISKSFRKTVKDYICDKLYARRLIHICDKRTQ
jgi:hypothetical protein